MSTQVRSALDRAPAPAPTQESPVDRWIRNGVAGKSFADLGGLWGTLNEKVTVAALAGASSAAMIDYVPQPNALWDAFHARASERGVAGYDTHVANLDDAGLRDAVGTFDVVHCSGVLYHVPNPFHSLVQLRSITRETLMLTSVYVPQQVATTKGTIGLSDEAAFFVPAMNDGMRAVYSEHFADLGVNTETHPFIGVTQPVTQWCYADGTPDYAPFWWLWTPGYVRHLLATAGFDVLDQGDIWPGKAMAFLCRKR